MHEESEVKGQYIGEVSRGWIKSGVAVVEMPSDVVDWLNETIIDSFEGGVDSVCLFWGNSENLGQGLHLGIEITGLCSYSASAGSGKVKGFAVEKVEP